MRSAIAKMARRKVTDHPKTNSNVGVLSGGTSGQLHSGQSVDGCGPPFRVPGWAEHALYYQDDWKVAPRLTLNPGVRWEYFPAIYDSHDAQSNFIQGTPFDTAAYLKPRPLTMQLEPNDLSSLIDGVFNNLSRLADNSGLAPPLDLAEASRSCELTIAIGNDRHLSS